MLANKRYTVHVHVAVALPFELLLIYWLTGEMNCCNCKSIKAPKAFWKKINIYYNKYCKLYFFKWNTCTHTDLSHRSVYTGADLGFQLSGGCVWEYAHENFMINIHKIIARCLAVMVGWTFKCVVLSMNLFTRYSNLNLLIWSASVKTTGDHKVVSTKQHYYTIRSP